MTQIGRYHAVFRGSPVEYVNRELVSQARLTEPLFGGTVYTEEEVENHLLQTQAKCDAVAQEILFRQVARANPRTITGLWDLKLEPDDIIQIEDPKYGPRRFLISTITRTLQRGVVPMMTLNAFEITAGVAP